MTHVTGKIHYIGVNDRRKHLFENMWPLPYGVSYNSYLIADEKTALIDTVDQTTMGLFYEKLDIALQGRTLDYLIVNHIEPDHSGAISALLSCYPDMKIIGNLHTFKILKAYFGEHKNLVEIKDGDQLDLGYHKLSFHLTPFVHWPETMMTYDSTDKVMFSGDAFGSFRALDGGIFDDEIDFDRDYHDEMLRYYSNIVGKYSNMVQKALQKVGGLPMQYICATHGPIWRKQPSKVVDLYNQWSSHQAQNGAVIAFASMYGNNEQVADHLARLLTEKGVRNIHIYDVSKTHVSFLISEIWKYKAVLLGSCAYNSEMHPMMHHLCHELQHVKPKNKILGLFGSYSWSGGGVRTLTTFAEEMGWEQPAKPVEVHGIPNQQKLEACDAMATNIVQLLNY